MIIDIVELPKNDRAKKNIFATFRNNRRAVKIISIVKLRAVEH